MPKLIRKRQIIPQVLRYKSCYALQELTVQSKNDLIGQLTNARNNYVLGLAALSLFTSAEALEHLKKSNVTFGGYTVEFAQVARLLENKEDRETATREFVTMLLRALVKESFEMIKDYCENTNQSAAMKSQPWYQFARLIRNCISHNFNFEFNPCDKRVLPVTWNSRIITIAHDGQPLPLSFFGYVEAWEIFKEFDTFASALQ